MSFAGNLKRLREKSDLTQDKLSRALGISISAISMYENGNREPDFETLELIADYYNVDMNYLLGRKKGVSADPAEAWARPIIEQYQRVDRSTRAAACAVLSLPYIEPEGLQEEQLPVRTFTFPSAAGFPVWVDSDDEYKDFPASKVPHGTDFAIRITGDSMEPAIADGSYAFIHAQPELESGQIGIFMLNDDQAVCKRYYRGKDAIRLVSDNVKYDPILVDRESDNFRVVGRVLSALELG